MCSMFASGGLVEVEEPHLTRTSSVSVLDDGGHALVASARALGSATSILPVVSTLSFGFAAGKLLEPAVLTGDETTPVLILLALSACFSLYTTTYSVLEFFYISMLTASDAKSNYNCNYLVASKEQDPTSREASQKRDDMARQVNAIVLAFEPWRWQARNSMWLSLMLILAAAGTQTALHASDPVGVIAVVSILSVGALIVPLTVLRFRRSFAPLLENYRAQRMEAVPHPLVRKWTYSLVHQ